MPHWPQWIFLGLVLLSALIQIAKDGEPRNDKYSAGMAIGNLCLTLFLLYFGGFFQSVGWGP